MTRHRTKRTSSHNPPARPAGPPEQAARDVSGRRFLLVGLAVALVAAGAWGLLRRSNAPEPPAARERAGARAGSAAGFNLLLITLDTVRADHLGCYGDSAARTPNLDALARGGLRFAQAIAPAPLTMPSHATMLTGLNPPSHGVRDNGFRLADNHPTLAGTLAARGYSTAAFVGSFIVHSRFGLARGFATYDDSFLPPDGGGDPVSTTDINRRPAGDVTGAALPWLSAACQDRKPFFAWIHYFDAHYPYVAPREYTQQFPDRPYDAAIGYIDAQVGRVLDMLQQSPAGPRTLIVVAGDHGEGLEEHGEPTHGYLIYDSTMRVPLILHNPAVLGAPRVIDDRVVSLADIAPTVLDLLGVAAPGPFDGRHLLTPPPEADRAIYIETLASRLDNNWAALHGLRRLHDKYILAPRPEYFDLRTDPGEQHNLAGAASAAIAELDGRLGEILAGQPALEQVAAQAPTLSEQEIQRLASLGYVSGPGGGAAPASGADPKDMLPLLKQVMAADVKSLQGQHAAAIAEIEAAVAADPTSSLAWYYATSIYRRAGRTDEAIAAVRRALALSPKSSGYVSLAQLLLLKRVLGDEFEQALEKAKQIDPHDGGILVARGDWYVMQGRFDEALAAFEEALRTDPTGSGRMARDRIEWVRRHR